MVYKNSFFKNSLVVLIFLTVNFGYSQNEQNPDGRLTFYLKDNCGKDIVFDDLKYAYNKGLIIYDKSNNYTIKIKGLKQNNSTSVTNLKINNVDGISNFEVDIGWSSQVIIEFIKKRRAKVDTMIVFFENIYELSAKTEIKFKKGNYKFNVKEFLEENKIAWKIGSEMFIKQKYLKRIE